MSSFNDSKLFYLTTGKNIKKYRDLRNYSLQVLAEKVGLTKKTIQRYENGEIKINMDRLRDLAVALDVNVTQLTEGTNVFSVQESGNENNSVPHEESELAEIPIEKLNNYKLVYKGQTLSKEEADDVIELLEAALKRWKK